MIILDLNISIIFGMILIHLHALGQILFLGRILEKYSQYPIFTCNSVSGGDLQPSILKASNYMTADHGESFQLQTFFMILLRMFYHVRPVTFDGEPHIHMDNWHTNGIVNHLGIVDVISDDIGLSWCDKDKIKGQSTSIIVPNEQVTVGEFADITSCPNVVDLKTLCERNGCTPPQFIRKYTNLFSIADGEDYMIPTLTLKTSVMYKSMGESCVEVTNSYNVLSKIGLVLLS